MKYTYLIITPTLFISACSTANWYQGMQNREQALCLNVPDSEYEDCMKQTKESYESYREKLREQEK